MTAKQLLFRSDARLKLLAGATALADAIRLTLGPRSKSVLIQRRWGSPLVCNDGVTIAKEMELADPEQDLGVRMMRQAAERTGDAVGDGTSTSTVRRALEAPTRQIAESSGADPGVVVDRMRGGQGAHGFDAARGEWCDLVERGIVDPTKVVRVGLENAVSVAGVLLVTEATLTGVPEPKRRPAGPAMDEE